jgi:hypothetical protein
MRLSWKPTLFVLLALCATWPPGAGLTLAQTPEEVRDLLPAPVADLVSGLLPGTSPANAEPPAQLYAPPGFEANDSGDKQPSLLFTYWEQQALANSIRLRGLNIGDISPGDAGESNLELFGPLAPDGTAMEAGAEFIPEPGVRELSLSGIVYLDKNNWRVFLNDTEIRNEQLPEQAIVMEVSRDHVDIQWFDPYTNQIFPIRLRVGQRFNLDMRTFLPHLPET